MKQNSLKDRLFALEPLSPERQEQFQHELATIINPRLPRIHRLYYVGGLVCVLIGLPGAICGFALDVEHRWIWALNVVASTVFAGWIFFILRRGSEPLSIMQGLSKGLSGISCLVAVLIIAMGIQTPTLSSILWSLSGLLFFVLMSFINLWNRVITAERTVREHILRVEYRIAVSDDYGNQVRSEDVTASGK